MSIESKGTTLYREAGVDIGEGDRLVDWLKDDRTGGRFTHGEVISGIGGFAGLFKPNLSGIKQPVLVGATDGIGTKLLLGIEFDRLQGLGLDLVAMCVNDLYTVGASPLFFLDYYATGALQASQFQSLLRGIREGCSLVGASLLGGETAELPDLYKKGHFDLAGFVVGMVDEEKILRPENVTKGDILIGLPSSGFHSNGYSLIRKWLKACPRVDDALAARLLEPTRIYHQLPALLRQTSSAIHAMAHVTGGGISGNVERIVPESLSAQIDFEAINTPEWMRAFFQSNGVDRKDVESVFNLGLGMVMVVDRNQVDAVQHAALQLDLEPFLLGEITDSGVDGARVAIM